MEMSTQMEKNCIGHSVIPVSLNTFDKYVLTEGNLTC